MKRTLFNTMMGCFAALSLAGCGGSGSSSSGPSESLISEGFVGVAIDAAVATSGTSADSPLYALVLNSSDQTFKLYLLKAGGGLKDSYHVVEGTWSAKSSGNRQFELSLTTLTPDKGCTIYGKSVDLTIDDMVKYRNGEVTWVTLSEKVPFIHDKAGDCGYILNTDQKVIAKIQQLRSLPQ